MSERSLLAYEAYREASQKFDYFVTGLTGTLCAFIGTTFEPSKIDFSPQTMELLALCMLVSSVLAGFKRIEVTIETHKFNHHLLHTNEGIGKLVTEFNGKPIVNKDTGHVYSPKDVPRAIEILKEKLPPIEKRLEVLLIESGFYYKTRNILLFVGFSVLVASRVWTAYL
jgi:hypothetical protein